ncbi:hypothetical protein FC83_GL002274 [Agrilactobacillus composti DSM 18527 = JCM 14202]|uniref:Uncharacterized protein n=1 Tax=Agrilactobacillus composti DSM 18527 = JCM 14202 TaxID=1423734 RepID=X0PH43_9LACO|nr:hypothetical protein [Agrilactobacillus composti]KRM36869.1 hypothetical protein FC83_GL002274 [Agrilactobacillus composti DSM 18527 = JCM 14202]GAF41399.1 hypothetical protein JCM14202_3334 [Agrilactobacillus composti DSM 18527 = JCM 14202]
MSIADIITRFNSFNSGQQAVFYLIIGAIILMILEPFMAYFIVTLKKRELDKQLAAKKANLKVQNQPTSKKQNNSQGPA